MSSPGTTDPLHTPDPVGDEGRDRLTESGGELSVSDAPVTSETVSSQPPTHPDPGGSTDSPVRSTLGKPDTPSAAIEADTRDPGGWRRLGRRAAAGVVLSLVTHAAILYGLSLWLTDSPLALTWSPPLVLDPEWVPPRDELTFGVVIRQELGDPLSRAQPAETLPAGDPTRHMTPPEVAFPQEPFERTARWTIGPPREDFLPSHNWLAATGAAEGGGLEGRGADARYRLLLARGGTPASEAVVQLGLQWLASAQLEDGSWHFNHHAGPLRDKCSHAGSVGSTTGATALGLLPFLGAGVTPDSNHEHREAVSRGLNYLLQRQQITATGADLQEGTMYSQGLATLALCEAYAMTGDRQIGEAAQRAIDFIGSAQHAEGGWRYFPRQPGDMTVTGWQLMALRSGQLAQLRVPRETLVRATRFLNRMESERGAFYGYMEPGKLPSPTAIGLLMRMYNGWPREDERLAQGAAYLAELGPSRDDMYFNYYATQVLHHYEGPCWDAWNETLRAYLIETQSQEEFERGSWYFFDRHGAQGGRHYNTAMAIMILEVYYRYLPLYTDSSIDDPTEPD